MGSKLFRARLKERLSASEPTVIGDAWHIRAIIVPVERHWRSDRRAVQIIRAETKRRFEAALRLAWPS